jgi:hypothetical protein
MTIATNLDDDLKSEALDYCYGNYYLNGSRLFNETSDLIKIDSSTDYDFCVEYSSKETTRLIELGFLHYMYNNRSENNEYLDMTAMSIWYGQLEGKSIQVVQRHDCKAWMQMVDSITPEFYDRYIWKSGPYKPSRENIRTILNQLYITSKGTK